MLSFEILTGMTMWTYDKVLGHFSNLLKDNMMHLRRGKRACKKEKSVERNCQNANQGCSLHGCSFLYLFLSFVFSLVP